MQTTKTLIRRTCQGYVFSHCGSLICCLFIIVCCSYITSNNNSNDIMKIGVMKLVCLQICIFIYKLTVMAADTDTVKTLTLHGFLPMTGKGWTGGGACLPAVLMALRHVNERPGLLDGYNLTYSWVDTQVGMMTIIIIIICCFMSLFNTILVITRLWKSDNKML